MSSKKKEGSPGTQSNVSKVSSSCPIQKPVNRNVYEMIGGKGGNDKEKNMVSGGQPSKPVNRNVYEMIGAKGNQDKDDYDSGSGSGSVKSSKKQPTNRPAYEMVGDKAASSPVKATGISDKSAVGREGSQKGVAKSSRKKRRKMDKGTKKLVIGCSVFLGILVLSAIITFAVLYGGSEKPSTEKPTFASSTENAVKVMGRTGEYLFKAANCPQLVNNRSVTEIHAACVWSNPPVKNAEKCTTNACHHIQYHMKNFPEIGGKLGNVKTDPVEIGSLDPPTYCLRDRDDPDDYRMSLCINGACSEDVVPDVYNGTEYGYTEWIDNCGKLNPCWEQASANIFNIYDAYEIKEESLCRDATIASCPKDKYGEAMIWIQHLACAMSASRASSGYCTGGPIAIVKCAHCPQSPGRSGADQLQFRQHWCKLNEVVDAASAERCMVSCTTPKNEKTLRPMGIGVPCKLKNTTESYCVHGMCMDSIPYKSRYATYDDVSACEDAKKRRGIPDY